MDNNVDKISEPELLIEVWDEFVYDDSNEVVLVESEQEPDTYVPKVVRLLEAIDEGKGALYIEGIFIQANKPNNNKRVYPKAIMEREVARYIRERVNTGQALGEFNHPKRNEVDPMLAAVIVEKLWWVGDNLYGRARVIEGDSGPGDKLAANIRAGWIPGVSSRGVGSVRLDPITGLSIVQNNFRLTVVIDVVFKPSAPDAYVKAYRKNDRLHEQEQGDLTSAPLNQNASTECQSLIENTDEAAVKELIAFMTVKLL